MSTQTLSTPAEKYLDAVQDGLADLPSEDIEEVLQDLAAHIAELGDVDIEEELGSPGQFIAEFRSSAGLDTESVTRRDGVRPRVRRLRERISLLRAGLAELLGPVWAPISRRRDEIRNAWVWSRGAIAVLAFSWTGSYNTYGLDEWLVPHGSGMVVQLAVVAAATALSVWMADRKGRWWNRADVWVTLLVAAAAIVAMTSPRYIPSPEEQGYVEYAEPGTPVLLIGPNGPIQNLYAYDVAGTPVQVLLYDEYGNPILTLPEYAYAEAEVWRDRDEPFVWEGYEIRFRTDVYGRPIGNLYPLDRYEWTESGARSAPQPPPVAGIPEFGDNRGDESDAGSNTATTTPATTTTPTTTSTTGPAPTTTAVGDEDQVANVP